MKRRQFLTQMGMGVGSSVLLANCGMNHDMATMTPDIPAVSQGEFLNALKIPETITNPTALIPKSVTDTVLSGKSAQYIGYRAGMLGPTIRVQKGASVGIKLTNQMTEHTNIHWHGLVIPADMDGHPDQMVMAGQSFDYKFTVNQPAGTNWYHPHLHKITAKQVTQGLAGLFIVESPEEKALNLPSGNYEVPLIIQDKRLNTDGTIKYAPTMNEVMTGYMGETLLVNGTATPFLNVATRYYRFRVLNGSSARVYNLALSNAAEFYVIGSDGGLLPQPQSVKSLLVSPGERADLLINFGTNKVGDQVFLMSNAFSELGTTQGSQSYKILSFNIKTQETDTFKLPSTLVAVAKLPTATKTRTFAFTMLMNMAGGMHKTNNKVYDAARIDETVTAGTTEIWEFDNSIGDEPHPMHIHGVQFQVLSRTGGRNAILSHETGWKDTVLVAPLEKVKVIATFGQKGKFVAHCHNLEHEDDGMMWNFEVK